jgi:hypothetical protein
VSGLLDDRRWLLLDDCRVLWDDRWCLLPRSRVPGRALLLGCCLLLSTVDRFTSAAFLALGAGLAAVTGTTGAAGAAMTGRGTANVAQR